MILNQDAAFLCESEVRKFLVLATRHEGFVDIIATGVGHYFMTVQPVFYAVVGIDHYAAVVPFSDFAVRVGEFVGRD